MTTGDLQQAILGFVTSFESHASAVVDDIEARQHSEVADFLGEADRSVIRDAAAVGVALALSAMRIPPDMPAAAPEASRREARQLAAEGGSLSALLQSYRVGHAVVQEHLLMHAERTEASMLAVRAMTERLFSHIDRLMLQATQEYMEERRRRNANADVMLMARVERVLDGEPETLPYPLDGHHIAVVLDAQAPPNAPELLAGELDVPSLRVQTPDGDLWLWLNVSATTTESDIVSLLEALVATGCGGVSDRASGAGGFALAHRQAALACRLGSLRRRRVSSYSEVALEALAFGGQNAARDFARAELGLLADDGERTATLRRTVQTYFANGSSAAAAAADLGVAERTVTYRLRRAEELVGRPLAARRAEIEAALRLHGVLGPAV
jgi:hypothetical protein